MEKIQLRDFLITLITNEYHLLSIRKITEFDTIVNVFKYDKIGAKINYSFLLSHDEITDGLEKNLLINSKDLGSTPVFINDKYNSANFIHYKIYEFEELIGGFINTGLILIENIDQILDELGFNKLPDLLTGKPNDLHEIYVKEGLQYLLNSPARRYGSDRRFESLPDGVVIGKKNTIIYFDSKSASDGYEFTSDDIKRFAGYVTDFNNKYKSTIGTIFCFLVITGRFEDSESSINKRSKTLYELCQTNLSCVTSKQLGEIIKLVKRNQSYRDSINWRKIFSNLLVHTGLIESELNITKRDKII